MHKILEIYNELEIVEYFSIQHNIDINEQDYICWTKISSPGDICIGPDIGDVFVFLQYGKNVLTGLPFAQTKISTICKCSCKNLEYKWPSEDYFNKTYGNENICGPHIKFNGKDECIWKYHFGWLRTGLLFNMGVFKKKEEPVKKQDECPLCGAFGDDLVFKFYCKNRTCQNFHP
jgi:hypothetical protein